MLDCVGICYFRIWRAAVGLLAAIGVVASLVFVNPETDLVAFAVAACTLGAMGLSVGLGRVPNADLVRLIPRLAAFGGLAVLAICGYAAAVGTRTIALVLLVAGASPPVVSWLRSQPVEAAVGTQRRSSPRSRFRFSPPSRSRSRSKRLPQASSREVPVVQPQPDVLPMPKYLVAVTRSVSELSDEELCLAWRRSFTQLQRAAGAERRTAMADVRRAYLDELERRYPDSFADWMASNPRAAGDPARFFIHRADH
ncbi:MAG TPA: hypothetical protein VIH10_10210 [Kribbella sp.]|jgi:hypothetical protein